MIAYKLFRLRKNGTLGSLFINRQAVLPVGKWMEAKTHPTTRFVVRHGWHCLDAPYAPHLSKRGRVWAKVEIEDYQTIQRPASQGGRWYLADIMRILEVLQ